MGLRDAQCVRDGHATSCSGEAARTVMHCALVVHWSNHDYLQSQTPRKQPLSGQVRELGT